MTKLKYTLKQDLTFKILFVKYPNLLKKLVADLLRIPFEGIEQFEIRNPEIYPDNFGDKFCRLDINMMVDGQRVDLEIQVKNEGDYPERSLYYWAREYSTALHESELYSSLPKTVVISIVDFKMFDCAEFHSEFRALEVTRHTELTDKFCLHYFELPKLPKAINKDDRLKLWLSLFNAETEEELKQIEELEVPDMEQAIQAYKHITITPEFEEIQRLREKARYAENVALHNARKEGAFEIASRMIKRGRPIEEIMEDTGLTRSEIEKLK